MSHESIRSLIWEYSAFFEKNMVLQIEVNALLAKGLKANGRFSKKIWSFAWKYTVFLTKCRIRPNGFTGFEPTQLCPAIFDFIVRHFWVLSDPYSDSYRFRNINLLLHFLFYSEKQFIAKDIFLTVTFLDLYEKSRWQRKLVRAAKVKLPINSETDDL